MRLAVCLILGLTVSAGAAEPLRPGPVKLSVEHAENPIGIDAMHPRLTWQLAWDERGAKQTAYEIDVAATPEDLGQSKKFLWATGRVASEQSVNVVYAGAAPVSAKRYSWRVRVWDEKGRASAWSEPALWEMGLLHATDWQAKWITPDWDEDAAKLGPSPIMRKAFQLKRTVVSARLYATSLGFYEMQLNGQRVGDELLTPGWTDYDARLQYQTYDVTAMLKKGDNVIGTMLGDGWYRGPIGPYGEGEHGPRIAIDVYGPRTAMLAQLLITFSDGSMQTIGTDETWKASTGPILFSEIYDGETYDARLEKTGWSAAGYDDHGWAGVRLLDHAKDKLVAQVGPPVRRIQELKPVAITHSPQGDIIFDMGQNMAGWVRLKVRGPAGTTVTLRHAEVLDKDGNFYVANLREAKETNSYTLKGVGEEVYEPHFTYQGFRYVAIKGYPGEPTLDSLTGVVIHSDMERTGEWESSNALLNRLQQNIVWSQKGNFVMIPTDCPQRDERLGWLADAEVFARTSSFNYDVDSFYAGWLRDLAADQKPNGDLPNVIPDARHTRLQPFSQSREGWGDAAVIVPWTLYLSYGDKRVLEDQYPSMKAWVDYLRGANPTFLVRNPEHQHGDWLAYASPPLEARAYPGATTGLDLAATAYYANSVDLLAKAAAVLGKSDDVTKYRGVFEQIKAAWDDEFVTPSGRVGENTQTAYTLALRFNLIPVALHDQAVARLAADVKLHKDHITTGFMGTPNIEYALSDNGQIDAAYALLEQKGYPSWLYPVTMGATTMWERWDAQKPDGTFQDPGMSSFNHYARGAVGEWMYRVVAGIDLDPAEPGYKHVLIQPQPGGGLSFVRASLKTGYGEVASAWEVEGDGLKLTVTIPPNTHATVRLPGAMLSSVKESGKLIVGAADFKDARQDGSLVRMDVGSGTYVFTYPAKELAAKLGQGAAH